MGVLVLVVSILKVSIYDDYVAIREENAPYVEQMQVQLEDLEGMPLDYKEVRDFCDKLDMVYPDL